MESALLYGTLLFATFSCMVDATKQTELLKCMNSTCRILERCKDKTMSADDGK